MRNIWLIIRREYLERVRTRSFLISTILFPAMMLGFTILPAKMASMKSNATRHIAVVSENADFANAVKTQLEESKNAKFAVDVNTEPTDATRTRLKSDVSASKLDGYVWLTKEAVDARTVNYYARETGDFIEVSTLQGALRSALMRRELMGHGMTPAEIDKMTNQLELEPVTLKGGEEKKENGPGQFLSVIALVLMLYMTLLIYGMSVMRSVLEEKTSRVMEVVLSSAKASELMAGKILGVGSVGLTQIAIWLTVAVGVSTPGLLALGGMKQSAFHIDLKLLPAFVVFFMGGYMLYSALFAALGSMVNSEQEAQQWQTFVTLPIVVPMMMMWLIIRQPSSPMAVWMSMVPFFSPILMYMRIVVATPPWYEIAASIAILAATILGVIWLCSRIYRIGILMYGKKPTLPEIVKWVKYA
jgi:ABC-2 type transport system permease protein